MPRTVFHPSDLVSEGPPLPGAPRIHGETVPPAAHRLPDRLLHAGRRVRPDLVSSPTPSDPKAHDFFVAATFVMVAGFIVSLGAALTGFMDWWKGIPRDRKSGPIGKAKHTQVWRTINWHATVMLTVTASR